MGWDWCTGVMSLTREAHSMPHFTDVAKVADREYNGWVGRGLGVWKGGARLWEGGGAERRRGKIHQIAQGHRMPYL